jgi:hypothetical protein
MMPVAKLLLKCALYTYGSSNFENEFYVLVNYTKDVARLAEKLLC